MATASTMLQIPVTSLSPVDPTVLFGLSLRQPQAHTDTHFPSFMGQKFWREKRTEKDESNDRLRDKHRRQSLFAGIPAGRAVFVFRAEKQS